MIGKVGKSYGILGWITVFSFSEKKEKIFNYLPWFFLKDGKWTKIHVNNWKKHKKKFIVQIKGVSNLSESKEFVNSEIIINECQLPRLKKNEYYWFQIINYKVLDINKNYLGKVINLIRTNKNDILMIQNTLKISKNYLLIPFVEEKIIKKIDTNKKIIIVEYKLNHIL